MYTVYILYTWRIMTYMIFQDSMWMFYVVCFFCDLSSWKRCFWDAFTETRIDLNLQTSCKPTTNSCKTQYSVPPTFHSLRFIYPYVLLVGSFKLAATRNHVFHCLSCQVVTAVALFYGGKLAMEGTKKKTQTLLSMFWNWWYPLQSEERKASWNHGQTKSWLFQLLSESYCLHLESKPNLIRWHGNRPSADIHKDVKAEPAPFQQLGQKVLKKSHHWNLLAKLVGWFMCK